MIPYTDDALRMLSQRLMMQLLPDLRSSYTASDGLLIGLLMNAIADELSEGIQRRLTDIDEMQILLADAAHLLREEELLALEGSLVDYTLNGVNDRHDVLTRVVIDLHKRTEQDDAQVNVTRSIWAYLDRHAKRHEVTAVP